MSSTWSAPASWTSRRPPSSLGPAAARAAPHLDRARRGRLRPRAAGPLHRRPAAHPAATRSHAPAPPRGVGGAAPAPPARPAGEPQPLLLRRRRAGRRPPHRGGHPVRAARALQGGRGEVGAGGAVRADNGGARGAARRGARGGRGLNDLARTVEALLFLSPEPVSVERLADASEVSEGEIVEALARLREHYAEGYRGVVLREVAGGFTVATDPVAERAARRLLARPRTPPLSQAQ